MSTSYSTTTMPRLEAIQQVEFKRGECLFLKACVSMEKENLGCPKAYCTYRPPPGSAAKQKLPRNRRDAPLRRSRTQRGHSETIALTLCSFSGQWQRSPFFSWTKNNGNDTSGDRLGSACGSHKRSLHLMLYAVHVSLVD